MKTLTVLEYAQQIAVAPVTVYRRINRGELQAITEDGVKKVIVNDDEIPETHSQTSEIQSVSFEEYISELKREIERLEAKNDELLNGLQFTRQRSDTIILQLATQVKEQHLLLEDMRQRNDNHSESFWRRLFWKKRKER